MLRMHSRLYSLVLVFSEYSLDGSQAASECDIEEFIHSCIKRLMRESGGLQMQRVQNGVDMSRMTLEKDSPQGFVI